MLVGVSTPQDRNAGAIRLAIAVSGLLIGFQVAGKATRDALFLSQFPITALPRMVAAAAIISLVAALAMSRLMGRLGPGRMVPILLFGSAAAQVGEWAVLQVSPHTAAVLVYIHFNALGALMVSAFWSLINERFDPRAAKQAFAKIGTAGTVGGVLGGLFAERAGALMSGSVSAMLPALALIHFACALLVIRIRSDAPSHPATAKPAAATVTPAGFRALSRSHYLRLLAASLLLATVSEGLLDYVFKDYAKSAFGRGDTLLRFFALFYSGINLLGGILGASVGRRTLEKFGIARTVSTLPWGVAIGGVTAIAFPSLVSVVFARAAEATMRNSLYRSGFELLFTPMPPEEKRAAKPLLDVGAVRIGDMLAALLVQLALWIWLAHATTLMLAMAVVGATIGIVLTFRIHRGYVEALEHSLVARAFQLELGDAVLDRTTRMTMARATPIVPLATGDWATTVATEDASSPTTELDPALARMADLHAASPRRVHAALLAGPLEPVHVARAIALLARDDVGDAALDALMAVAPRHTGQLVDALLDPATDFAVRRRIPTAIAASASPRAIDGLLSGLHDPRFEVRARCGRSLVRLAREMPNTPIDPPRVIAAVLNEVAVDRQVWESHRLMHDDGDDPMQVGTAIRERTSRSLEHVFTVLSLVLPRQPLQIAFQGLHTDDPQLRGTALEYLETALPVAVREKLWPFIGDRPMSPQTARPREQVVAELMQARSSIMLNLEDIKNLERQSRG